MLDENGTLRFDAIRRVVEQRLASIAPGITVRVISGDRNGRLVENHVPTLSTDLEGQLKACLAGFSIKYELMAESQLP